MDELMHYGVKGMKWGIRKKYEPHPRKPGTKTSGSKKTTRRNAQLDKDKLIWGKRGANRISERMQKGDSRTKATLKEAGRQTATTIAVTGAAAAAMAYRNNPQVFNDAGRKLVNSILSTGSKRVVLNANGTVAGRYRDAGVKIVQESLKALKHR